MENHFRWIDRFSLFTLVLTLILFTVALFEKGFTHDLLLEAGVFLVSVKLVLSARKNELMLRSLDRKIGYLFREPPPSAASDNPVPHTGLRQDMLGR